MYRLTLLDKVLLVSGITISIIYYVLSTVYNGSLPAPFFYVKSDTFMDFYHIQYWTYDAARYTEWKSIYPPFSFWLLSFFPYSDNGYDPLILREEGVFYLIGSYVITTILILYFQSKTIMYSNKILLIMLLSIPFLFAIERGNLLIYALLFLLISVLNYRNSFVFGLFLAMAISIKIYLIALLFIPLLNLHLDRKSVV